MIIALIIYFAINAILAVILTIAKAHDFTCKVWHLTIYSVVMLCVGLPIVVVGFLYVWIVGLIAKKHGDF